MLGFHARMSTVIGALIYGAIAVVYVVFVILYTRHCSRVAGGMLACWAQANSYQFIVLRKKWFRIGPFRWRTGNAVVFRGALLTPGGEQRTGYFRVGTFFLGLMSDQVDVEWDK